MKPTGYKVVAVTTPVAIVDNASWSTTTIDTKGFRFLEVYAMFGAMDIAATALKLQESDDSGMSGAADITGAVYGTSTNDAGSTSTLPSATSDNTIFKFEIDLRGHKRYIDLVATGGDGAAGSYMVAWANLHEGENVPSSATAKGCAQVLKVPVL